MSTQSPATSFVEQSLAAYGTVTERLLRSLFNAVEGVDSTEGIYDLPDVVDFRDELIDSNGDLWSVVGSGGMATRPTIYRNEADLDRMRSVGRMLSDENEFAINGHENRVSYIVGWGHTYTAVAKADEDVPRDQVKEAQDFIDEFVKVNRWNSRQQEIVRRWDRDGEVFIRFFNADGMLRVRFVEPESIKAPSAASKHESYGIKTDPEDYETIEAYYVDGQWVEADRIQHRKNNVDSSAKRGIPTFWPVRKNLARAAKIQRNMSAVVELQAAIGMIRKHAKATESTIRNFVINQANVSQTSTSPGWGTGAGGNTRYNQRFGPGSIIDGTQGIEYEFPQMGIDPSKPIAALQSELRAVAARLCMPEFMLTSDASNANFSSTMVAEGPAVKMFERLQWHHIEFDKEIFDRTLRYAAESGLISADLIARIEIQVEPPTVQVRDRYKEAQTAEILDRLKWISPQTGSAQFGLDYQQEQSNREKHDEANGGLLGANGNIDPLHDVPGIDPLTGLPIDHQSNPVDNTAASGNAV